VTNRTARFDNKFIERQRAQLTNLRASLLDAKQAKEQEEADINAQSTGEALESEDDAQRLTMLELDGNLVVRDLERLTRIERALKKIDEGTYGFSDASGDPIPVERLEAVPEAIFTVAEQELREPK
jgi:DnaK suppressor protein